MNESSTRSWVKAFTYRLLGSMTTALIAWVLTQDPWVALAAGGVDSLIKIGLFFTHERIWNRIPFGRLALDPEVPAQVLWLTGLPASGKTTLARELLTRLESRNIKVEHLDGDEVRAIFPNTGFDRESRDQHIRRVAHLASRLEAHGVWVIVSMVSPIEESRSFARTISKNFSEIFLNPPLAECARRDPKGLYAKSRAGEINDLTGPQSEYEAPAHAEFVFDTSARSVKSCADAILARWFQDEARASAEYERYADERFATENIAAAMLAGAGCELPPHEIWESSPKVVGRLH